MNLLNPVLYINKLNRATLIVGNLNICQSLNKSRKIYQWTLSLDYPARKIFNDTCGDDHLLKYGHFIPLKVDFIHNVAKLHDIPTSIVSDKGKAFTSKFWQHLFHSMRTILAISCAYHP